MTWLDCSPFGKMRALVISPDDTGTPGTTLAIAELGMKMESQQSLK